MRFVGVLFFVMLLACVAAQAAPVIVNTTGPAPLDLSPENMNIVSTEHTAEYLAKVGGLGQASGIAAFNASGAWFFDRRSYIPTALPGITCVIRKSQVMMGIIRHTSCQ